MVPYGTRFIDAIVYNPPTKPIQTIIDTFLLQVDKRERDILSQVNKDLMASPDDSVGTIFDVQLQNGHFYRTEITDYNYDTKQFTIAPGKLDNWPNPIAPLADLNTLGIHDTLDTVPHCFAIRFNPIRSPENLGKLYRSRGKLIVVEDLHSLEKDLYNGRINSCPHNGSVARRYVSASRRESNANRYEIT